MSLLGLAFLLLLAGLEVDYDRSLGQCDSPVLLAPAFDVRQEMDLGLLGHPRGVTERCE
jgi:hypothetical protein